MKGDSKEKHSTRSTAVNHTNDTFKTINKLYLKKDLIDMAKAFETVIILNSLENTWNKDKK